MKTKHILLLALLIPLTACEKKNDTTPTPSTPSAKAASAELLKVLSAEPKGEPAAIHIIRTSAKPGDVISIKGRVMGSMNPFVDGRSIFTLGDTEKLTACSDNPDDGCETPWDNCCDSPEDIKVGTATIQVVDTEGKVLREGIENVGGLAKLSYVVVTGTVASGSTADLLLLNADAIQVQKTPEAKKVE